MPTVINNDGNSGEGGGMGNLLAVVLLIIFVFGFLYFGLPMIRNATAPAAPSVTIPDKVDVNVNQK